MLALEAGGRRRGETIRVTKFAYFLGVVVRIIGLALDADVGIGGLAVGVNTLAILNLEVSVFARSTKPVLHIVVLAKGRDKRALVLLREIPVLTDQTGARVGGVGHIAMSDHYLLLARRARHFHLEPSHALQAVPILNVGEVAIGGQLVALP